MPGRGTRSARRLDAAARDRRAQRARPRPAAATSTSGGTAGRTSRCCTCGTGSDGEDRVGGRSQRARCRRHDRARLVLSRARTAGSWPTACPRTAASRACSTCSTWTPATSLPDRIPRTRAADLAWLPDGSGLLLHPLSRAGRGARRARSTTTAPSSSTRSAPIPPTIRWSTSPAQKEYWPGVGLSPDGRWLLIGVARTFDQTDLYLGDLASAGRRRSVPVAENLPASFDGEVAHGRLFLRTNLDAPTYRLYEVDPERPGARATGARWCRRGRTRCSRASRCRATGWRSSYLERASSRLRLADLDGGAAARGRRCPTLGSLFGVGAEWDGHELFYGFSSYTVPPSVYRLDLATGEQPLWRRVEADVDPERFEVRQVSCPVAGRHRGHDVPGAPAGARARTATTRSTSPGTAASTSA